MENFAVPPPHYYILPPLPHVLFLPPTSMHIHHVQDTIIYRGTAWLFQPFKLLQPAY